MNFPTLYKRTSTGAIQEWKICTETLHNGAGEIVATYGQFGGAMQISKEVVLEGKNVGKSNETIPYEQACAQAQSQWEGKKKKGYVEDIEDARSGNVDKTVILGGVSPMLAHKFAEQGHKIKYPCYVQPKLDGHRCIAVVKDGSCTLWSRTQKQIFGVPHISNALAAAYPAGDHVFDGELYNHDYKDRFNELTSFIRQTTPKAGHEVVQYWIYDIVSDKKFSDRNFGRLTVRGSEPTIQYVKTVICEDDIVLQNWFEYFLAEGFEGAMARNAESLYAVGNRSYDLQKIKEFEDAEFEIVNVVPGVGKMSDKGVFICQTKAGAEFKAKMVGELDSLRKYLDNKNDYIGKMVTVKYQGLHPDTGIPRFGVAMRLREDV